ncbi:MAG: ATP-binding cassette domain-containing protein, partial [Chlamydiota bacterium]
RRVFSVSNLLLFLPPTFLSSLFSSIFGLLFLVLMFHYSATLSFFALSLFIFGGILHYFLIKLKIKVELRTLDAQGDLNGFVLHVMNGIEKIRLSASESTIFSKWGSLYTILRKNVLTSNHIENFLNLSNSILPLLGIFGTFFFGFRLISTDQISPGNFIAFTAAFGALSAIYYNNLYFMSTFYSTIASRWLRAKLVFDTPTEYHQNPLAVGKLKGFIEMENIHFRYQEKGTFILKGVSFQVEPGEMIGIVGPSGCGKSTLLRLLLQFEKPHLGAVYFDGKNLSDLDARKIRKQIGVVLQDSDILSGSIRENLLCGCFYTNEQVEKAMFLTGFDKVIQSFPMGLFTHLVDKGKNLSLGQKQLLLLTRSLIREPRILLLDEAINSLDNQTQQMIMENLEKLKMTRIIISHRISTLRNADRIYVLIDGQMQEVGSYEALSKKQGFFSSLLEQ